MKNFKQKNIMVENAKKLFCLQQTLINSNLLNKTKTFCQSSNLKLLKL